MNRSLVQSLALHLAVLLPVLIIYLKPESLETPEKTTLVVVEKFKVVEKPPPPKPPPPVEIKKKPPPPKPKKEKVKKVFGLSRKSITAKKGVQGVKIGNTVAKTPDKIKLKDEDPDQLPLPADEFLISSMPAVIDEVRPKYPPSAKAKGLEGKVVLEILIDDKGVVRQAKVVRSLDPEMDQRAKEAILAFKFRPAKINDQAVAAKIKYAINFVLE